MTLRDYLAAHAPVTVDDAIRTLPEWDAKSESAHGEVHTRLAMLRYAYADAMLLERGKP